MVTTVCTFFAHGPRVQRAPGIPCALRLFGREMMGIPRAKQPAGMRRCVRSNAGVCLERVVAALSAVMPRFMRGIQYAAASRLKYWRLWNTGSPDQVGR